MFYRRGSPVQVVIPPPHNRCYFRSDTRAGRRTPFVGRWERCKFCRLKVRHRACKKQNAMTCVMENFCIEGKDEQNTVKISITKIERADRSNNVAAAPPRSYSHSHSLRRCFLHLQVLRDALSSSWKKTTHILTWTPQTEQTFKHSYSIKLLLRLALALLLLLLRRGINLFLGSVVLCLWCRTEITKRNW